MRISCLGLDVCSFDLKKGRVAGVPAAVCNPSDLMVENLSDGDAMEMAGGHPLSVVRGYVEVAPEDVPDEEERSRIQQMVAGMDDLWERPQVFRTPGGTYCVLGEATIFIDGDQVSLERKLDQIGRASCRERVCQYV